MWNGAMFSKSIGSVQFVRLSEMSYYDWRLLEYENLRNAARNKIAQRILSKRVVGFLKVSIVEKARAKPQYLESAVEAVRDAFYSDDFNIHDVFGNSPDEFLTSTAAYDLQFAIDRFIALPIEKQLSVLEFVRRRLVGQDNSWAKERLRQVNEMGRFHLEALDERDAGLLLTIITLWEYSLEEAEKMLDELEDSDEKDEVAAELENARAGIVTVRDIFT